MVQNSYINIKFIFFFFFRNSIQFRVFNSKFFKLFEEIKIWPDKFFEYFIFTSFFIYYSNKRMFSNNYDANDIYQNDKDLNYYFILYEEKLKKELLDMIDNDHNKVEKKKPNKNVIIIKPKFHKNSIENQISFENIYNEIPSRSIIIGNIPEETEESDIKYILSEFGDYQSCDFEHLSNGKIVVRFYDLLDAMLMRASTIYIHFRSIIMSFGSEIPVKDKKRPPNNGTIVVFNLPDLASDAEIYHTFSKFGQIRDIRKTPNKSSQRFVEFYDSRSAFKAKKELKKKKMLINGKYCQINVEFSLPGNFRVNHEKYYNHHIPTIQRRSTTKAN